MKRKQLSARFDKRALLENFSNLSHPQMHRRMHAFYAAREDEFADERVLCNHLTQMFPDQAEIESLLRQMETRRHQETRHHAYNAENLPFHTRDMAWLVKYAMAVVAEHDPQTKLRYSYVANFVAESSAFDISRREYEQRLIRAQIPYLLNKPTPNALMDENCCPHNYNGMPHYDKFFRNEVIRCMGRFGIPDHDIEVALEQNKALWWKQTAVRSFENTEYPLSLWTDVYKDIDPWWHRVATLQAAHQDIWLKVREYEYYQDHHEIIDELGLATPNMLMKPAEVSRLQKKLVKFENTRDKMFEAESNQIFLAEPERTL